MSWILDIAVVAVCVLFVAIGASRGAVRSIVEFVGFFAAILIAVPLGGWLAETSYTAFFREPLVTSMEQAISGSVGQTAANQISAVSAALPGYVSRFFDGQSLAAQVQTAVDAGAASGAQLLADQVVGPVLILILRAAATILLFLLLMLVIRLIARAADLVAKLPVIHQLNKLLGMACGAAKAALVIFLAAALLRAAAPFVPDDSLIGATTVQHTVVLQWVNEHNPLYGMMKPAES